MATPPDTPDGSSTGPLPESTPQDDSSDQNAVPTPAAVEESPAPDKEAVKSKGVFGTISSTKLFIAAQVLEQEARKLQSLHPGSNEENLEHRLNLAISVLEEVQKEMNEKNNNGSQKDDASVVAEYEPNYFSTTLVF